MIEPLFDEIVAPVPAEEFLRDHWRRQALHLPADARRFRTLAFDRKAYDRIVAGLASSTRELSARFIDRAGMHRPFTIRPQYFETILAAGITVCIPAVDEALPTLAEQCRSIETTLEIAGQVYFNCYVAPPGGGFGLHFDTTDVFTIQIEGEKTWWYGPTPALPAPPVAIAATVRADWERLQRVAPDACVEAPETTAFVERTLRRGEVLYLPAGTWHRTSSVAGSVSLAMSIAHRDAPARSRAEIRRTDWFQRVATFAYAVEQNDTGEPAVVMSCGDYRLTAALSNRAFFERLSATPRFVAEAALAWDDEPLDWEDVQRVLGALLESGIIYRVRAAGA